MGVKAALDVESMDMTADGVSCQTDAEKKRIKTRPPGAEVEVKR
jgi:hypothetical protein